jgi:hypothetical protein
VGPNCAAATLKRHSPARTKRNAIPSSHSADRASRGAALTAGPGGRLAALAPDREKTLAAPRHDVSRCQFRLGFARGTPQVQAISRHADLILAQGDRALRAGPDRCRHGSKGQQKEGQTRARRQHEIQSFGVKHAERGEGDHRDAESNPRDAERVIKNVAGPDAAGNWRILPRSRPGNSGAAATVRLTLSNHDVAGG